VPLSFQAKHYGRYEGEVERRVATSGPPLPGRFWQSIQLTGLRVGPELQNIQNIVDIFKVLIRQALGTSKRKERNPA
jgi:hypothetical protein